MRTMTNLSTFSHEASGKLRQPLAAHELRTPRIELCLSLVRHQPVFKIGTNKWLSHGQPGYNLWLSVQVFGCPYLEHGSGRVEFHSWGMKFYGCSSDNRISIFGCPATFLVVPGARTTKFSNADTSHHSSSRQARSCKKVHMYVFTLDAIILQFCVF